MSAAVEVGLAAVVVAVTAEQPRVLTVGRPGGTSLPSGLLDSGRHRTLELALRDTVLAQTGYDLGYVEQLYTFGNRYRDPRERSGGPRAVSVAYLALAREVAAKETTAEWIGWYDGLPWEDWRRGRPELLARVIEPAIDRWIRAAGERSAVRARRERADLCFGLGGVPWNGERVLDRFELLYEIGLVAESDRERRGRTAPDAPRLGREMALDHRRILASALGRLRGKLRYRPVVFELLPQRFTLLRLQRTVEALAGLPLHKQNFRRLVEGAGLVEGTGRVDARTGGRPAELFRFRREVLRERPAPGVGLPGLRTSG
ncbi:MAG: NAD regulator [Thermoanaerobaculia bacterium]